MVTIGQWPDIEYLVGIRGGAKIVGHSGGVLGMARGGHLMKWVPWPSIKGNPQNLKRGTDISNYI